MDKYPAELRVSPVPVIALVGSGKFQVPIRDTFAGHNFKPLCYDLGDPIAFSSPPKRPNYEGYVARASLLYFNRKNIG